MEASLGVRVVCENISFVTQEKVAEVRGGPRTYLQKEILSNVNLAARPGEVFAIMGPSGSGKTSLLNIMAGRTRNPLRDDTAQTTTHTKTKPTRAPKPYGQIYFNGHKMDYTGVKHHSRYVMQTDCLLPFLSVEETITFGAKLKLTNLTRTEQRRKVDSLITELGLDSCRKVIIGNQIKKGVSGGQKKRVAIALELLGDPPLVYLDEPTSGLDSSLAFDVVKTLQKLARNGRTIIATIHQPRSQIFRMFDKLLLLSNGRVVFHGPANEAAEFTASIGHPVPPNFNSADFFLDLLTVAQKTSGALEHRNSRLDQIKNSFLARDSFLRTGSALGLPVSELSLVDIGQAFGDGEEEMDSEEGVMMKKGSFVREVFSQDEIDKLPMLFEASRWGNDLTEDVKQLQLEQTDLRGDTKFGKRQTVGRWFQNTCTLTHRTVINKVRNPLGICIGIGVTSLMTVITGGLYFKIRKPEEEPGNCLLYFNFVGVLAFSGINNSFSAMQAVLDFPERRPQYNREVAGSLYHPSAYFMGMQFGDFPFTMILPIVHALIIYWMVDIGYTTVHFFFYLLLVCLIAFAATSWAQLAAMASRSPTMASTIIPIGVISAVLLSGLWITESALKHPWKDLKYISWIRYGLNGFLQLRFHDSGIIEACAPLPTVPNAWGNLGCCFAFGIIARFISYLFLRYTNTRIGIEA